MRSQGSPSESRLPTPLSAISHVPAVLFTKCPPEVSAPVGLLAVKPSPVIPVSSGAHPFPAAFVRSIIAVGFASNLLPSLIKATLHGLATPTIARAPGFAATKLSEIPIVT